MGVPQISSSSSSSLLMEGDRQGSGSAGLLQPTTAAIGFDLAIWILSFTRILFVLFESDKITRYFGAAGAKVGVVASFRSDCFC